jgi:hypothetical protein
MARENSFSDENRSLTPDLDEVDPGVAVTGVIPAEEIKAPIAEIPNSPSSPTSPHGIPIPVFSTPKERFRSTVKKVMQIRRASTILFSAGIGAEPGIDPRRQSAFLNYGHIKEKCLIEIADYSGVRSSFGRMTNQEFITLLSDPTASSREPWVKVRWINIGGISWDVLSCLALKYGKISVCFIASSRTHNCICH